MRDSSKYLLLLFCVGAFIVFFRKIGFVTFHMPLLSDTTRTAMAACLASDPTDPPVPRAEPTVITETPSPAHVPAVTPTMWTPYIVPFPGFAHCRTAPSSTSPEVILIRGHDLLILAQNQTQEWLYVEVEKKRCWIYRDVPFLELTPKDITRVPTRVVTLTLALPTTPTP